MFLIIAVQLDTSCVAPRANENNADSEQETYVQKGQASKPLYPDLWGELGPFKANGDLLKSLVTSCLCFSRGNIVGSFTTLAQTEMSQQLFDNMD